jgi:arylsulfatase A-like enzyme
MNGSHRQFGVFVLSGKGIEQRGEVEAGVADVSPTLLAVLGEDVPTHMQGKARVSPTSLEVARADVAGAPIARAATGDKPDAPALRRRGRASGADARILEDRLRKLGYLE